MVSLLTGSVISRFYTDDNGHTALGTNSTFGNITLVPEDEEKLPSLPADVKIRIIITLTFLVGITQVSDIVGLRKMVQDKYKGSAYV